MRAWLLACFTLGADQLTKLFLISSFVPGQSRPVLPPILFFTYVQNTGAAFGLFKGQQVLFIGLSIVVIGWMGWELATQRPQARMVSWACALLLGGAIGNLIDRLRYGYVIDFIDLRVWPVFNIADSAITIGVMLLLWQSFRKR